MEQIVRDTRISTLYEGTTEIQSLDLIGRKVIQSRGELLQKFTKIIHKFCEENRDLQATPSHIEKLCLLNKQWSGLSMKVTVDGVIDPEEVGPASVDFMYLQVISLLYIYGLGWKK